jgi:acyl-CoA reductase-like NAD-dependent aldehyde dehydrogenase
MYPDRTLRTPNSAVEHTDRRFVDVRDVQKPLAEMDLDPAPPELVTTAAGLTRAAMTAALDRIERAGYVKRTRDGADRRAVRVEVTDHLRQQCERIYEPIAAEGRRLLSR